MREARPTKSGGGKHRKGSFDGHGASVSTIPDGAAGVWDVDERGRSIKPKKRRGRQGIRRNPLANAGRSSAERPITPLQQRVLDALDETPRGLTEIAKLVGCSVPSARAALFALKEKGKVDSTAMPRQWWAT